MLEIFARHGYQNSSQNGSQNRQWQQLCVRRNSILFQNTCITHFTSEPYWPRGNAEIERFNRTILKAIRTAHAEGKDWRKVLATFLLDYRSAPHSSTGETPAKLLFNREIRTKLPQCTPKPMATHHENAKRNVAAKEKMQKHYDQRMKVKDSVFTAGDKVLLKRKKENKLSTLYSRTEYTVQKKKGSAVTVRNPDGQQLMRKRVGIQDAEITDIKKGEE